MAPPLKPPAAAPAPVAAEFALSTFADGDADGTFPSCTDTDGDLVGLGFRLGLYMLAASFLVIYLRGAKAAAAGCSQITMICYFAVFVTLYSHGTAAVSDVEFITITYLMALFAVVASFDYHLYLAHAPIKTASPQHRLYFLFRFLLISLTSILTYGLFLAFWSTYYREMRCGEDRASAFLFAQVPAYGGFRVVILLGICALFLYSVLSAAYTAFRLASGFEPFVKALQQSAREEEEGTYWEALGEASSRHFSQLVYGAQKLLLVGWLVIGAELTIKWNKVPFVGNVYDFGQILFLMLGLFSLLQSLAMPTD